MNLSGRADFVTDLIHDVGTFTPLFRHAYNADLVPPIIAPHTVSRPDVTGLHPKLLQQLTDLHADLTTRGELLSLQALKNYYETFRRRFGPDVLRATSGEALLSLMHETAR